MPAPEARLVLTRIALGGEPADYVNDRGRVYGLTVLPQFVRPAALARIRWHQQRGDVVTVVSASLDVYLTHWCRSVGVNLICTILEQVAGVVTGRYVAGDCSGARKASCILERHDLKRFQRIYAYGDSPEDRQVLNLAHERY